jgi:hypothetical protein
LSKPECLATVQNAPDLAAPIIGGMITSAIHVLIITPVIFYLMKQRAFRKGTLRPSTMALPGGES